MDDLELISTKERPGAYDGLETAKPGEPVFVVQGGDLYGPPTVLHWAKLARAAGIGSDDAEEAEKLLRKATAAELVAWAMQAYQRGEEAVPGRRAHYNDRDVGLDGTERHEILARGAEKLHNALAEALLIADALARLREYPESEVRIRNAVEMLKESAFDIEPRRHLRRKAG